MLPEIKDAYLKAAKKIFFFDYDGTLVPFSDDPERAMLDPATYESLEHLSGISGNNVVIISGRDKSFLEKVFNGMNLILIAEHGFFLRFTGGPWKRMSELRTAWKPAVLRVLSECTEKFPGTMVEEKETSIAWHYRTAEKRPSSLQIGNLKNILGRIGTRFDTEVLEGNHVIEIKDPGINKGIVAGKLISELDPDFIMALGDDLTDEYLFQALPDNAYTFKIGAGNTHARYCCTSQENVIGLIEFFLK